MEGFLVHRYWSYFTAVFIAFISYRSAQDACSFNVLFFIMIIDQVPAVKKAVSVIAVLPGSAWQHLSFYNVRLFSLKQTFVWMPH